MLNKDALGIVMQFTHCANVKQRCTRYRNAVYSAFSFHILSVSCTVEKEYVSDFMKLLKLELEDRCK
jgi:hypothetical protein